MNEQIDIYDEETIRFLSVLQLLVRFLSLKKKYVLTKAAKTLHLVSKEIARCQEVRGRGEMRDLGLS